MLTGPQIVEIFTKLGITHVVWLPDSTLGTWESALSSAAGLQLVRACREGEAWTIQRACISAASGRSSCCNRPASSNRATHCTTCTTISACRFGRSSAIAAICCPIRQIRPSIRRTDSQSLGPRLLARRATGAASGNCRASGSLHSGRRAGRRAFGGRERVRAMPNDKPFGGGERAAMPLRPAFEVIQKLRGDAIVVTTMGEAREWPQLRERRGATHPLDFQYLPSAMGHAPRCWPSAWRWHGRSAR